MVNEAFGSPAILGPPRGLPWLLGGSEDPWLSVPVFWRVWLFPYWANILCSQRVVNYPSYTTLPQTSSQLVSRFIVETGWDAHGIGAQQNL